MKQTAAVHLRAVENFAREVLARDEEGERKEVKGAAPAAAGKTTIDLLSADQLGELSNGTDKTLRTNSIYTLSNSGATQVVRFGSSRLLCFPGPSEKAVATKYGRLKAVFQQRLSFAGMSPGLASLLV